MPADDELRALVRRALEEDVGAGDVTTEATVPSDIHTHALITQKAPGAIYGLDATEMTFTLLDPDARFQRLVEEGRWREPGDAEPSALPVLSIEGSARALLSGERTALNLIARLSGVATMTARARRGGGRTPERSARHAQDHARAARAGEGRGGGRRAAAPTTASGWMTRS